MAEQWETVPRGTRASQCRGATCKATIYWIERESRSKAKAGQMVKVPVDCDVTGGYEPTAREDGQGRSHYETCPDAGKFGRGR